MNRIRKGDQVVVISGASKGQTGAVLRFVGDSRLVVENINMVKRATKPNPQKGTPGGLMEREAALHSSNVMLLNPATGKGSKVSFKSLEDGRKVRVFRSTGEVVDA